MNDCLDVISIGVKESHGILEVVPWMLRYGVIGCALGSTSEHEESIMMKAFFLRSFLNALANMTTQVEE
jgi:hypothetical protein